MAVSTVRNRYLADTIGTVPPARLVVMLYDGLLSDVERAQTALTERNYPVVNERLLRAQAIVLELQSSLRPDLWTGGPALLSIYRHLYADLVRANITKDGPILSACRQVIEPLRQSWHEAAKQVLSGQPDLQPAAGPER